MTIRFGAPGNWCGVVSLEVQGPPGNWCEVMTIKLKGQGSNSTICRSPTHDFLRKSWRTFDKSWISQKRHQHLTWRAIYWSGDYSCRQRWTPLFILDQLTIKIWKYTGTPTSKSSIIWSISRKDWYWNMKPKFWMYLRLNRVIEWTKAKIHVYTDSVLCAVNMQERSGANQRWLDQHEEFQQSNSYKDLDGIDGEPTEFEWDIFLGFTLLDFF